MVLFRFFLVLLVSATYFLFYMVSVDIHAENDPAAKEDYDAPFWLKFMYIVAFALSAYSVWFTVSFWNAVGNFVLVEIVAILLTLLLRWFLKLEKED